MGSRVLGVLSVIVAIAPHLSCGPGTISTPRDADRDDDVEDGGPDGGCGDIECPRGTECVGSLCVPVDPCRDVVCDDPGERCSAGRCVPIGTDEDGDGFDVTEDCDDTDPAVFPGVEAPCTTGCGAGVRTCRSDGTWGECHHPTNPCVLPNATAACVEDACVVVACRDGYSSCDGRHATGCETEGGCGSPGQPCSDVLACVLACSNLVCAAMCAFAVCDPSMAAATALVDCAQDACREPCDVPSSPDCGRCVDSLCQAQRDACLAAGC